RACLAALFGERQVAAEVVGVRVLRAPTSGASAGAGTGDTAAGAGALRRDVDEVRALFRRLAPDQRRQVLTVMADAARGLAGC
ncbi:MAG: hypothetical protein H0V19_00680, partial [Euzebyales bacterium]|nr:hypothetical protein [Euzebyales bacterium]